MPHTGTIAQRLAEKILTLGYDDLPAQAVHWAKLGFLDTVALTLAGAREPYRQTSGDPFGIATLAALEGGLALFHECAAAFNVVLGIKTGLHHRF